MYFFLDIVLYYSTDKLNYYYNAEKNEAETNLILNFDWSLRSTVGFK